MKSEREREGETLSYFARTSFSAADLDRVLCSIAPVVMLLKLLLESVSKEHVHSQVAIYEERERKRIF